MGQPASSPPRRLSLEQRLARRVDAELDGESALPPAHKGEENPTLRELEVFLAVVDAASEPVAAWQLGLTRATVRNHLQSLYAKVGASSRAHAACLLWPILGDAYMAGHRPERRLGRDRRRNRP